MAPPSGQSAETEGNVIHSQRSRTSTSKPNGTACRRRHQYRLPKDTIMAITQHDIRRLARRGGVKQINAGIYTEARYALKQFLTEVE